MKNAVVVALTFIAMMIGIVSQALTQGIEINCGDEDIIRNGIDIQFPNIDANASHTITSIGIDQYDPIIAVFNQQQSGGCNDDSVNASGYTLDFPTTGYVDENNTNAQSVFQNSSMMRVVAGEYDDAGGEFVLMVEGLTYDGNPDLINVIVTDEMIQSGLPLTAYVIEQTEGLNLSLALVDDNGVPLRDNLSEPIECDDAGDDDLCWGSHTSLVESYVDISGTVEMSPTEISPMLSVPLTPEDEQTIVPFQIQQSPLADPDVTGEYIFLLHVGSGYLLRGDAIATATTGETATALACDDETLVSDAVDITLPRLDSDYTVSVRGQDKVVPLMAVMDNVGGGLCYFFASSDDIMSAELPVVGMVQPSTASIRTYIDTETAQLLTGLIDDTIGSYLLTIEGASIDFDGTPDVVSVHVTESMVASESAVTVYMISNTLDLDPQLALVSAEGDVLTDASGEPIVCVNTSSDDTCWGEYQDMATAEVTLRNDETIRGISRDVMLRIPLTPDLVGTTLNFMSGRVGETFGDYTLIVHIPIGMPTDEQP